MGFTQTKRRRTIKTMRNKLTIISLLLIGFIADLASAHMLALQEKVPDRYTVVKGDTLWDISKRFLKQPWRWPEIWKLNKEEVRNPHWIYPGDTIVLERTGNSFRLKLKRRGSKEEQDSHTPMLTEKRSPEIRDTSSSDQAISSVPFYAIAPFLDKPHVIELQTFKKSPRIVQGSHDRIVFSAGDSINAVDMNARPGEIWQIYRNGKAIMNPDTKKVLAHEARYLGEARVTASGPVATLHIIKSVEEIAIGDRLIKPDTTEQMTHIAPHLPAMPMHARVASVYGDAISAAPYDSVILNQGTHSGLEVGHVLFAYKKGKAIVGEKKLSTPLSQIGNLFIYRVFPTFSYALVLDSTEPISVGDIAQVTHKDLEPSSS